MILSSRDVPYVPEVNLIEMFGYSNYFRGRYYNGIDGSAVGKYIKRNTNFSVTSEVSSL